ncbi:MAG: CHAT domain-containing protein [Allosphingosinicella sp.]
MSLLLAATGSGLCWPAAVAAPGQADLALGQASATPAASVCASQLQCERLLAQAANDGPTYATAQAWMKLAELGGEGGKPNPRHVLKAFETVKLVLAQDRGTRSADSAGRDADLFTLRLLPIFQAAADALAYERVADGSTPTDRRLIASLLDLGETARRAQIDLVLADSCEPLQVSLAPKHLLDGETIVYPIVGSRRTYLLVGRKPDRAGRATAGDGWTLLGAGEGSGASILSPIAKQLFLRLPLAAREFSNPTLSGPRADWGSADAHNLYELLIQPLNRRFIPPDPPRTDSTGAEVEKVPTLIFFPDPVLRNVPWALLHGKPDLPSGEPDYLVRRVAIAVGPGLAYVRPSPRPGVRGGLMLGGLGIAALSGFVPAVSKEEDISPWIVEPALSGSAGLAIASLPAGDEVGSVRLRPFTREGLQTALRRGDFSTLLLATHAQYLPGTSYFQIHPETGSGSIRMPVSRIEEWLREGRRKSRGLDLLIFLACEGAVGGAGDLGLAGAALRGGALSTVGALAPVQAKTASSYFNSKLDRNSDFLSLYYDSDSAQSAAQALRRVQLAYAGTETTRRQSNDLSYPANWGVFVVIGNWR